MINNTSIATCIKMILTGLFTGLICLYATAQKLPNKQEAGLIAPPNIKIDGKANEWSNQFKAYNTATGIYYTMANDNNNLYIAIQATDPMVISRIMGRGITLSIQKSGQKNDKNATSITYPVVENSPYFKLNRKKNADDDTSARAADSVMMSNNALLAKSCKWIIVKGISGIDTLLSVYNDDGIRAAGAFNNKKVYTCEVAVSLKLLNMTVNNPIKFAYHIRVNGIKPLGMITGSATPGNEAFVETFLAKANETGDRQSAPTDFWGEYELVK